jgi:F-type H+-transporting ATPase subunit a
VKPKTILVIAVILAVIGAGVVIFKGVPPAVILRSETIFSIGPFAVRNTVFSSWVVIVFLVIASLLSTRKLTLVPVRFLQNFVEAVVEWMYGVVEDAAGPANARRFFPLVATIFLYVICSNWLSLLPIYGTLGNVTAPEVTQGETAKAVVFQTVHIGSVPVAVIPLHPQVVEVQAGPNGEAVRTDGQPMVSSDGSQTTGNLTPYFRGVFTDANAPLSIAIVSFIAVEYWGLTTLGAGSYLSKFFQFGALKNGPMGIIDIFVGLLELLSEFIRIISFTFRLLGNIFAGEVLLVFMTYLVPFVVPAVFYGLEVFVGFIQASVFALLTLVFAVMAVQPHEHEEHEGTHEQVELEPA